MITSELIPTGIAGLDPLLLGGLPAGNIVLVEGTPGAGKTILGTEFIYRGITEHGEPGIIVVFETSPLKLVRDMAGFGWNLEELQEKNQLKIIATSPSVFDQELRSPDSLFLETAVEMGARRLFIDGIGLLRSANGNGQNGGDPGHGTSQNGSVSYRELLRQLIEGLHRESLTAMLTHEVGSVSGTSETLEVTEFLADTIIRLERGQRERSIYRTLEIVKSRGQDFENGKHTLRITPGKGLELFRRVQANARGGASQPTSTVQRSVSGIDSFDALLGGGLFEGSTTMVVGSSGIGKTILGTQMLVEGARKLGQRSLLVSLDEHQAQLQRNADLLGLGLTEQVESGMVDILFDSPLELELDVHFDRIRRTLEERDISRLLVDGLTTYSHAIGDPRMFREFIHALVSLVKDRLMIGFFNYENPELFGVSRFMLESGVSSIVDNIIVLSYVELGNEIHRAITVAKARGSAHPFATREYKIQQGGISLLPLEGPALPALPFQAYHGLLSRAPTRYSARAEPTDIHHPVEEP